MKFLGQFVGFLTTWTPGAYLISYSKSELDINVR